MHALQLQHTGARQPSLACPGTGNAWASDSVAMASSPAWFRPIRPGDWHFLRSRLSCPRHILLYRAAKGLSIQ